jgi:hypothetical protein
VRNGAAGEIRTLDLVLRRHALYPSELQPHRYFYIMPAVCPPMRQVGRCYSMRAAMIECPLI